jgi:type I restriction enzyme M protein
VLFRNEEQAEMRKKLVEAGPGSTAVIGLGPEPLLQFADGGLRRRLQPAQEAAAEAQGQGAVHRRLACEVARERATELPASPEHQQRIEAAYEAFADVAGFARVTSVTEILANAGNLSIPLYVKKVVASAEGEGQPVSLPAAWEKVAERWPGILAADGRAGGNPRPPHEGSVMMRSACDLLRELCQLPIASR